MLIVKLKSQNATLIELIKIRFYSKKIKFSVLFQQEL